MLLPSVTRRSFLSALGAGLALPAALARDNGYRLGLETYCFHDLPLAETLAHTAGLGLRHLELHDGHLPLDSPPEAIARARDAIGMAGLTVTGVYVHDAYTAEDAVVEKILGYARALGASYVTGGPRQESLPALNRAVARLGVEAAIHNHGPGARYETLEHVTEVLRAHERLSAVVDIGHFARSKVDPAAAIRTIGRKAVAVHIKDVDARGENAILGKGIIDLPAVFAAMRDVGFDGLVVLEYEGDFDNLEARLAGMRASLEYMTRLIDSARR